MTTSERVRLFVALELPPEIRAGLSVWAREQLGPLVGGQFGSGACEQFGLGARERSSSGAREQFGLGARERSGSGAREQFGLGARERSGSPQPELRLIRAEYLHVTLCFLGARPAGEVPAIAEVCRRTAGPVIALALGEPLWLPVRRPRVAAVALADGTGGLAELQRALSDGLSAGGFYEPEDRPFLAHVTVARVGHRARIRPAPLAAPERAAFTASAVTLYRSSTGPGGARYEPLATGRLSR